MKKIQEDNKSKRGLFVVVVVVVLDVILSSYQMMFRPLKSCLSSLPLYLTDFNLNGKLEGSS